ncbi:MAG: dnaE, partial [Ilumatobacteraceae bacterium]|nr:dnaE [Ilumatobacteraceae bacterium]
RRDEARLGFMAQDIQVVEHLDTAAAPPLHLRMPASVLNELRIHQLRKILREHPGDSLVYLHIGHGKMVRLADDYRVDLDVVVGDLRIAFGHDAVML